MKRPSARRPSRAQRKLSLANPPTAATMSIEELAQLTNDGRDSAYFKVRAGIFPSIRVGKGKYAVLTVPTLQILRGERPPGGADRLVLPKRRRVAKKRRAKTLSVKKRRRVTTVKVKPVTRKGETAIGPTP